MPLFGRQRARDNAANVTPRRRGWDMFSPYPQRNRTCYTPNLSDSPLPIQDTHTPLGTNPNNTNTNTTRRMFKGRTNDATGYPRTSRRMVSMRYFPFSSLRP